jgi:hypothetical protein
LDQWVPKEAQGRRVLGVCQGQQDPRGHLASRDQEEKLDKMEELAQLVQQDHGVLKDSKDNRDCPDHPDPEERQGLLVR